METILIKVGGMDCGGCETSIQNALALLDGVASSTASHVTGEVEVTFDPAGVTSAQLGAAIEGAGYELK
jgi:copper chaperone